ncbi:hypothetical protein PsYK624_126510 [Phanerochaete sordida]|uniref:F-box domain-containing protein n=1 Tax=Phanerochaete sordida TaxID=48140 RepID=A0A9P3GN52_9APHY|nr:hypothetical protein PsYK624_126510 [Phanerochaete sordida]
MPRDISRTCRLPQELVDLVLAQLRGDKKALKACSLVCWAWALSSATLLHEEFKWPPCSWQASCEAAGLDAQDASYTILLEALAASPRLRESVHMLRITTHRRYCTQAYENGGSLVSAVCRLLKLLPHLRSLSLPMDDIDLTTSVKDPELEGQQGFAIDDLSLRCPPHAIPILLSVFRRISKLSIRISYVRHDEGEAAPPSSHPIVPVEVRSIDVHEDAKDVLPILQHIIIPAAVHALSLDCTPTVDQPEVLAFVRSLQSLQYLECRHMSADKVPFGDGLGRPSLRSVTLTSTFTILAVEPRRRRVEEEPGADAAAAAVPLTAGHAGNTNGGDIVGSGWRELLRDLRVLVTRGTQEISLKLRIKQWRPRLLDIDYDDGTYYYDPEDVVRALRKAFSLLDWPGLKAVVRQSASLKTLRFAVGDNGLTTVQRTADLLCEAVAAYLPDEVAAKAHVINACE